MKKPALVIAHLVLAAGVVSPAWAQLSLTRADYLDRVQAIWTGQIIAVLVALEFEHKTASVVPIEHLPMKWQGKPATFAPVDDDWYPGRSATADQRGEKLIGCPRPCRHALRCETIMSPPERNRNVP